MNDNLYRWVLASERLPTKEDYKNTFGIIYKTKAGRPQIKEVRPYFDLHNNKASSIFYMWLEKLSPAPTPTEEQKLICSLDAQQCQQECEHKSDRTKCPFINLIKNQDKEVKEEPLFYLSELIRTVSRVANKFPDALMEHDLDRFTQAQSVLKKHSNIDHQNILHTQNKIQ